jgi:membrane associated rhomboid family serine protease
MPPILKFIIATTAALSIAAMLVPQLAYLLSLSLNGIYSGHYYQFLTAFFLLPREFFTFGFVINLIFNLYMIANLGKDLLYRFGNLKFILFLLTLGIVAELTAFGMMNLNITNIHPFGANMALTIGIMTAWLTLNINANLYLLHIIHLKASSAMIIILFLTVFSCISPFDPINLISYIATAGASSLMVLFSKR